MRRRSNRLAGETSPYLLQHATNPVDWYPWSDEALDRAKREDKPILLSIGYAACHWCHVMEHESFENEAIAALMNEHFVCIKVDREERPDLDEIHMAATVALSGSGGWPMTVFLTPEREPFFAGTYFPPEARHGRPGFPELLERVADLWKNGRSELLEQARELTEHVQKRTRLADPIGVSSTSLRVAARELEREFDPAFGGFGPAPKFPASSTLLFLLRAARHDENPRLLEMVERTLDGMISGGMYDQLGGGFARYSVDEKWLVPHFEKMLYDNAQLAEAYLVAHQVLGHASYRRVARETLDYLLREMQAPDGGFFSSSDADSEGEEGKFFVFSKREIERALGEDDARAFNAFYGVTEAGNFEGKNVLTVHRSLEAVAKELGIGALELGDALERGRQKLLAFRNRRVPPAVDDKILTAWNGLSIRALALGFEVLGDTRYLAAAARAADFCLGSLRDAEGRLLRTARAGRAHLAAYLEDHAFLIDGLLSLYEAGGDETYLDAALELAKTMLADFSAEDGGAFHHTGRAHEALFAKPREGHDGALPSANAVAARALVRLSHHTGDDSFRSRAVAVVRAFGAPLQRAPRAFPTLLSVVDTLLEPPVEIVLVGEPDHAAFDELAAVVGARFLPNRVLARVPASGSARTPLTLGKTLAKGAPAAYVCEGFSCRAPVTDAEAFDRLLDDVERKNRAERRKELGRSVLPGRATAEGTERLRARSGLAQDAYVRLGESFVSRVAHGTYRLGLDHPDHRRTLERGLRAGLNLIDTSPSFARGDAERLIGEVVGRLVSEGALARDEIVVVSKLGLALGEAASALADENAGRALRHTVPLEPGGSLARGAFSLDPGFLRAELDGTLERLGFEHLDVCLIQSPEHLLIGGASPSELEGGLREAFRFLESEVAAGRVGVYGILSNTLGLDVPARVDLGAVLELAREVGGAAHHFRVVECPINLLEDRLTKSDEGASIVQAATELGVFVLACRPLSALTEGTLYRLVDPPRFDDGGRAEDLKGARYKVASLEAEFETTIAPALRIAGLLGPEALLPLGRSLGPGLERLASFEQFEQAEATLVTPRLRAVLSELDRVHTGPNAALWQNFRDRYVRAASAYLAAIRETVREKNLAFLASLAPRLDDGAADDGAADDGAADDGAVASARPWAEQALRWVLTRAGVAGVALGMRHPSHVESALRTLRT